MKDLILKLTAKPTEAGFDILAISEGVDKRYGFNWPADTLKASLSLWDGVPVQIDHESFFQDAPSVRDLAGALHNPQWSEADKGISLTLVPGGPADEVLIKLRDAAKKDPAIMQAVGFSAVIGAEVSNNTVKKIARVKSVDAVIGPARGGKFLSAFPSGANAPHIQGGHMIKKKKATAALQADEELEDEEELSEQERAALELQGVNESIADLQEKQNQANLLLVAQCQSLLDSALSTSKLPAASQKAIRKPFELMLAAGTPFKATELQEAIADKRAELSEIGAADNIQGPGRPAFSGMINSADQFRLAVEDMFGIERAPEAAKIKVHRLTGIREAYLLATGDQGFMGGFYGDYALVTANFPGIVANVMNKILIKAWKDYEKVYGWWQKIATVEHFNNLNQVSWIRTGTIASLPSIDERGEYTELPIGDNKETSDWGKSGGYIPVTIEAVLRDDLRAFKRMPTEAALAGIRNISELVAAIFTQNAGAGPTMADGGALFNATAQTTAGGHLNLLTTALGTDYTAWDAVAKAMFKKKMLVKNAAGYYGTGKPYGIKPSICLVPADLIAQAEALFLPRWASTVETAVAVKGGPSYGGKVDPVVVPDFTDATDWAAVADPTLTPGVMIGEIFGVVPQIFSASSEIDPAMFANDESRIKVRQLLAVGVADDTPLAKNNVA